MFHYLNPMKSYLRLLKRYGISNSQFVLNLLLTDVNFSDKILFKYLASGGFFSKDE